MALSSSPQALDVLARRLWRGAWTLVYLLMLGATTRAAVDPRSFLPPEEREMGRPSDVIPGEVVVRYRNSGGGPRLQSVVPASGLPTFAVSARFLGPRGGVGVRARAGRSSILERTALVRLREGVSTAEALAWFRRQPDVLDAEPNFRIRLAEVVPGPIEPRIPDDFEFQNLWALRNTGQTGGTAGADIRAAEAWTIAGTGGRGIKVAVIDTGIDFFHPDLVVNLWVSEDEPGDGIDNDGNGYIDDANGYDFVSDDGDPLDDHGHGTHVAGTIGARGNNKIGLAGVCWETTLMAIKAFDETGDASLAGVVEAIDYAVANGADIINASWGHSDRSQILKDAVAAADRAGVLFIAAAGNENSDYLFYPAVYEHVVSVGATDSNDQRARFSNYGPRVDLAAPGDLILSTLPDSRYDLYSGTSMAAPHVTGVAALVWSNHPEFSHRDVANILMNSVDPLKTDRPIGVGRINARKAVEIRTPLPFVRLDLPASIRGFIPIQGTAEGTNFLRYTLERGVGRSPATWIPVYSAANPVTNGVLFQAFATAELEEGSHTFRLMAENVAGEVATDVKTVSVENVHLDFPMNNDVLRAGEAIAIRGAAFGRGRQFRVEYGEGPEPSVWTSAGMTLTGGGLEPVLDEVLAIWDTSVVRANAFYTLRLTATAAGQAAGQHLVRMVYLDGSLRPGWPRYLPMEGEHPTNDWRHLTVADLDGDRKQEVLLVDPGNPEGKPAILKVLGHDGALRWEQPLGAGEPYSDLPAAADMDGDGLAEVFADAGEPVRLHAFHHDGRPVGGNWPLALEAGGLAKVTVDLDGDGTLELVALSSGTLTRGSAEYRQLSVISASGVILQQWELPVCHAEEVDTGPLFPAVANLDDDPSDLEIVVARDCHSLAAFSVKKKDGPLWMSYLDGWIASSPVIGDLNHDGTNEVVVGTHDPRHRLGGLYAFNRWGERFSGWPVLVGEDFVSTPALADLDGDETLEVIVPGRSSEMLHVVHHYGFEMQGWPVGPIQHSTSKVSPAVADVDGDGHPDVILASPGYLYLAFTVGDLANVGGILVWNRAGLSVPLNRARAPWMVEASSGGWHKAAPAILTDLDGDGRMDLLAASIQDRAYAPPGQPTWRKNRSSLYAWELDVPFDPDLVPWSGFQGDARHTGFRAPRRRPNQPPVVSGIPDQIIAPGGRFFPIELDRFVEDPDHRSRDLKWEVLGGVALRPTITANRVVDVSVAEAAWTGTEALRFVVTDPGGLRSELTASYSVRSGYIPPLAADDAAVTVEDTPVELPVLGNDSDPNQGVLTVLSFSRPRAGKVVRAAGGVLLYTPDPDFHGADEFTYTLANGRGGLAIGTVRIQVTPVNDPPAAAADYVITDEDVPATFDVLANDTDADQDPVRLVSFTRPERGQLRQEDGGRFRYTPEPDGSGADQFTYRVADPAGLETEAVVQLLVKPVNDRPTGRDAAYVLNRNANLDISFDADDVEQDEITYKIGRAPANAELFVYPKIVTYAPKKGFTGSDSFTYFANDGRDDSAEIEVQLTVLENNNSPVADSASFVTKPGQKVSATLKASDLDGDPITYRIARDPLHGSVTGGGSNVVYQPNPGFLGQDSFTFEAADDQGGQGTGRIQITVTDQNTAPDAPDMNVSVRANATSPVRLTATDGESDPLTYRILIPPATGELSGDPPDLSYTPIKDFVGADRFTFVASDGVAESRVATVLIQVSPLNTPPVATNQVVSAGLNQPVRIALEVVDGENDSLLCPILKGPRHGRVAGRGTVLTYTPRRDYVGSDEFTYRAWDGRAYSKIGKVSINISSAPPPIRPILEEPSVSLDGSLRFMLRGQPGQPYEVTWSTNLVEWQPLRTVILPSDRIPVTDTNVVEGSGRFYRARLTQQ